MKGLLISILIVAGIHQVSSQDLIFTTPVKLGTQINSVDEELGALLSNDSKTLYFSRALHPNNIGGKFAGMDIWISHKDNQGQWLPASNLTNRWNNKQSNSVIGISLDHTVVYLLNAYSKRSGIAFSKQLNGVWSAPEFIPIPGINRDDFVGFYVNPKFDLILISMKGKDSLGEEDLYVSLKDSLANWTEPKNLGASINTRGFEISPFLSEDTRRLFFSSNVHSGFGDADIFYSDRLFDSWETWTVPKNLGAKINSKAYDAFFSIYKDSVAFFSSNREGGFSNIFTLNVSKSKNASTVERQYLTSKEVGDLVGNSVSLKIVFGKGSSILNSGQKELLYYVANKLLTKTEIKFQLTTFSVKDAKLTKERLDSMIDQINSVGIDSYRIQLGSQAMDGKTDQDTIEIIFFR